MTNLIECVYLNQQTNNIMKIQLSEDLKSLTLQLVHTDLALNSKLKKWERKEYQEVRKCIVTEIKDIKERLINL